MKDTFREKSLILCLILFTFFSSAIAQNTFHARLIDSLTQQPLEGATVFFKQLNKGSVADENGQIRIGNIPDGRQIILYRLIGYAERTDTISFPLPDTSVRVISLVEQEGTLEEVTISSTRSSRTIDDIPTRVEIISADELDEKSSMQPANAKMILTESTGIQTQQTSATSASAGIRIQGLDGKYTLLLKDGFPLYSEFASGLSIVQIPPLDLKRVEVIKGASSTLYGGGAIAGLVNFVSKVPVDKKELSFLFNVNQTGAVDASGFYSQKYRKLGFLMYASSNTQKEYDVNHDGLSDIPQIKRLSFNPGIFFYPTHSTTLSLVMNSNFENRFGGDMEVIRNNTSQDHVYFEKNKSSRYSAQFKLESNLSNHKVFVLKNSIGLFDRKISKPGYEFGGRQVSDFAEASYLIPGIKNEWIFGGNLTTHDFRQTNDVPPNADQYPMTEQYLIAGIFLQSNYKFSDRFSLESGLRLDKSADDYFPLPRISALYKFNPHLTTRIGGGLGYKLPTIFSEETEEKSFQNIRELSNSVSPEKSAGANGDINYKTAIYGKIAFTINQMFFVTRVNSPLILEQTQSSGEFYEFINADGYLESKGWETNIKLSYEEYSFFLGYTYIDAVRHFSGGTEVNPLTSRHRLYGNIMYEIEKKLRLSFEYFYTGKQWLSDGESRPGYFIIGASAEYFFRHFSVFLNSEDLTDRRQSRYESMYTNTIQSPDFREIWAPTDGFIFNGGVKINVW